MKKEHVLKEDNAGLFLSSGMEAETNWENVLYQMGLGNRRASPDGSQFLHGGWFSLDLGAWRYSIGNAL